MERLSNRARMISAIVANDLVDGLTNKKLLTNMFTIVFLVLLYRFLPVLGSGSDPTRLVLYDEGASSIVRDLDRSEEVRLRVAETYEDMVEKVGVEDMHTLGIVLSADFDQWAAASDSLTLEAIVDHWVNEEDEAYMRADVEPELTRLLGVPVRVNMVREEITQADGAYSFHIGLLLLIVLALMGMMFTTNILIQEKVSRTLDTLQVSPATMTDVLIAKGLVGGIYSMLTGAIVLFAYSQFVLHWWAILVAMLAGTFFNVSVGLLLGVIIKDPKQLNLWGFIILQPFIITMIVGTFEAIAESVRSAMRWFPTVALGNAAGQSLTASVDIGPYIVSLLVMVVWGAAFFVPAVWLQRRAEA